MTFRRRLLLTITALLVSGYFAFSVISLVLLDRTLRSAMEAKLATIARAASDIVDDNHGKPSVDADDVTQLSALHGNDEHLGIFDTGGKLIFGEPLPSREGSSRLSVARARAVHDGHYLGWVTVWRDASWIGTVWRSAIIAFVLAGTALVLVAVFFSGLYARAILNPVQRVADLAEKIETSDLSKRLNARGNDEIARLCASFDRMLERLQASFETERRFVSDASHELRAPLAVVRAETDLALRRERDAGEYRAALESIDRETLRLEQLVDQLLHTMRQTAIVKTQTVDASALVGDVIARLRPLTTSVDMTLAADASFPGDADSIERALAAVLHNAVTHGGGAIRISVFTGAEHVSIAIADNGPGFTSDALRHATERFWRGDSARSRGGTGLGLAIARILVEAHGGRLTLTNGTRGGAIVTIDLPRVQSSLVPS